jgi:ribosome-binding ATPase
VKDAVRKSGLDAEHSSKWSDEDLMKFARELRRVSKPMIIAANKMDRPKASVNFKKIKEEFDYPIVPCFAEGELALREADKHGLINYVPGSDDFEIVGDLSEKQKLALDEIREKIKEFGSTGIQEVLNTVVFGLLRQICVFPAGEKMADSKGNVLPDCYLMPAGSTALEFAYRLHSDIGKNFVKAILLQTKRAVGKDYELKHRDGLEIMIK